MIDFQVAYDKLAGLETANEIADLFRGYDVKAIPGNSEMCAISVWMNKQTGLNIKTNLAGVSVVTPKGDGSKLVDTKLNTRAMWMFVRGFDTGQYPDLERSFLND